MSVVLSSGRPFDLDDMGPQDRSIGSLAYNGGCSRRPWFADTGWAFKDIIRNGT